MRKTSKPTSKQKSKAHGRAWGPVVRRGQYIGKRVGGKPKDEAEHFMRTPQCGGRIDMRDLGQVFEHEGPLPHPKQDQQPSKLENWSRVDLPTNAPNSARSCAA